MRNALDQWHYVVSQENPADLLSRGTTPRELRDKIQWWKGPSWLSSPNLKFLEAGQPNPNDLEVKVSKVVFMPVQERPAIALFEPST